LISILFGLSAALFWGSSDFLGGIISRRIGAARTTLYVEMMGFVALLIAVILSGAPGIGLTEWLWCTGAGVIGSLGMIAFNQALSKGQMSIAAPVSSLTAAALPVLVGIFLSGLPPTTTLIGIGLALAAIWLITQVGNGRSFTHSWRDLRMPLLAGLGFGFYFIFIHQGSQNATIWPMLVGRATGAITVVVYAALTRQLKLAPHSPWGWIFLNMVGDIGGNFFYIIAGQSGRMDVAVVLSSLYSFATVILGWLILHEKLNRSQLLGVALALASIVLLSR
jgi:drug/metabolite transporter (DMT)-like permease